MERIIWTLWWQGEEAAPSLVRACIASMRAHANGAKVVVLDKTTYTNYLTIPQRILEKAESGKISLTHLSDIIRVCLIREYGGLWMDSTVFVMDDIPQSLFDGVIWTPHFKNFRHPVPKGRWATFLMAGERKSILFDTLAKMLISYWETHDAPADYILPDYFFRKCYETLPSVKEQIDLIPYYDGDLWELMHRRADGGTLASVHGLFQKTSYKDAFPVRAAGGGYSLYAQALFTYHIDPEQAVGLTSSQARKRRVAIARKKLCDVFNKARTFGYGVALSELLDLSFGRLPGDFGLWCKRVHCAAVERYLQGQECYRIAEIAGQNFTADRQQGKE